MSETFGLSEIGDLVEEYLAQLLEEKVVMRRMLAAQEATEFEKQRVISIARVNGLINGKNEAERAEQIAIILENSPSEISGYHFLLWWQRDQERAFEIVEAHRKALEVEISLTKAWLYSQSGAGK